ncbi:FkbM family methyltransferase [Salinibacter ruber]|uniref:FkbM family methyltransferase n=1 Tax=Salinibacter ruber TaxID=146919 RepID=UPI00216AB290|nr:FkbM family methyltransferase [Salinibacter ruber]MCS4058419.1 FkbM family methyltransferase [Salinibacter ruber]
MKSKKFYLKKMAKYTSTLLETVLGRNLFTRVSRYLWHRARLNFKNDFEKNGERLVLDALTTTIGEGQTLRVFDVGGNVGEWSALLVDLIHEKQPKYNGLELHLFEPAPAAAQRIRNRFESGDSFPGEVFVNEVAVAEESGEAQLNIREPAAGTNALQFGKSEQTKKKIDVRIITLDDYCKDKEIGSIDFIKVDTEGNDFNVLLGAEQLLSEGKVTYVQFEYNWRWVNFRCFLKDVFDLLDDNVYSLGKITPYGIEVYNRWDYELENFIESNYLIFDSLESMDIEKIPYWKAGEMESD